jgi:hypothetical protein
MAQQLFISYARKDHDFVDRLREDLKRAGLNYWIDHEGLSPGARDWEEAILAAIKACHSVIWVATPAAKISDYVDWELAIAASEEKRIIPVWAAGDNWLHCVPAGKHKIQYADMRGDNYRSGLKKLISALKGESSAASLSVPKEAVPTLPPGAEPRNPYKGLNAFTEKDAGDFFGRGALVDEMRRMVEERTAAGRDRLLAVLGPSGAGKSSVVMAGLLPKLGPDWHILPRIVPGQRPIENLADSLYRALGGSLAGIEHDLRSGARYLARLVRPLGARVLLYVDQFEEIFTLTAGADEADREAERKRFIDLLTHACTDSEGNLFVVLTMRADFYDRPMHYEPLGMLITRNQASVLPMSISELYEAVQKPALLPDVALQFDDGLVSEIVFELRARNAALEGALPLLEFTLARLFALRAGQRLTRSAYEAIGGVEGAISSQADALYTDIQTQYGADSEPALGRVFLPLTNLDIESGKATRKRAARDELPDDSVGRALLERFVAGRLLQTGSDEAGDVYIEVAHEALFRSWGRLKAWIAEVQEDLILLRQVRYAAHEWQTKRRPDYLLWPGERLKLVFAMQARLNPELNAVERAFIEPEQARLLRELENIATSHQRRRWIGERLAIIGDTRPGIGVIPLTLNPAPEGEGILLPSPSATGAVGSGAGDRRKSRWEGEGVSPSAGGTVGSGAGGESILLPSPSATGTVGSGAGDRRKSRWEGEGVLLPQIDWLPVLGGGEIEIAGQTFTVQPFYVARYLITHRQFQAFLDAPDGFADKRERWWQGFPEQYVRQAMERAREQYDNYPRDSVSWYQAVAFSRWLDAKYREYGLFGQFPAGERWQIRLPTEWEWQWLAQNGAEARQYPWGDWDEHPRANTTEAGIGDRSTVVGLYPHGAAAGGALDMAGNLWEWCLNDYDDPAVVAGYRNEKSKVLRGGSFYVDQDGAAASYRDFNPPLDWLNLSGLRVVVAAPISAL